jgi:hypothetical protein
MPTLSPSWNNVVHSSYALTSIEQLDHAPCTSGPADAWRPSQPPSLPIIIAVLHAGLLPVIFLLLRGGSGSVSPWFPPVSAIFCCSDQYSYELNALKAQRLYEANCFYAKAKVMVLLASSVLASVYSNVNAFWDDAAMIGYAQLWWRYHIQCSAVLSYAIILWVLFSSP